MPITKIIDNFSGRLTRDNIGDMNSGLAKYSTTFGNDPFSNPGNLTWLEQPTQIDAAGSVITDLIVAARVRFELPKIYVYAIGSTGRLYKIQVNDDSTHTPDYDTAVLLHTFTVNTPTFKYGASIQFYGKGVGVGNTDKPRIYVGHDLGVSRTDIDGSNESFVGTLGLYKSNIPRPSANFLGKLYFANGSNATSTNGADGSGMGSNLVEIDSTETVTSYAKLFPDLPNGTTIRDLDVNPNGTYLQAIVSYTNGFDMTISTQYTTPAASADSYKIYWNGSDTGYTSYESYNGYSINSNTAFANSNYTAGYDLGGAALYSGSQKIVSLPNMLSPNFHAMFSTGNLLGLAAPEFADGFQKASLLFYGQYDKEIPVGLFRFLRMAANSPDTDIIQVPICLIVSNLLYGYSFDSYPNNKVGSAKVYFSTTEIGNGQTTKYRLYKFTTVPTGSGTAIGGVYETQQETSVAIFRGKLKKALKVSEVRIYTPPMVANNSFQIDLIGPGGTVIPNTTATFTVGSNVTAGDTLMQYNPDMAPTYSIGFRITNLGSVNWVLEKAELDIDEAGK